jgi:hypothetical protein
MDPAGLAENLDQDSWHDVLEGQLMDRALRAKMRRVE